MNSFVALTVANLRSFWREPSAVVFSFAIPILFIVVFGLLFGNQGTPHYSIGLAITGEAGPAAQQFAGSLDGMAVFHVHRGELDAELKKLRDGDRKAVVAIPGNLGAAGTPGAVTVHADMTDTTSRGVVIPILQQLVSGLDRTLSGRPALVTLTTQSTTVQNLRYIDYLVPSILAMSLMQLGLYSAVTLVVQRETKLLRRLGATPLPRGTIIASHVAQRVLISLAQAVVLIAVGRLFFQVGFTHNLPVLVGFVLLGTLSFVAMGFIVGAIASSTETAMPLVQFIALPMLFLSGIFFSVDSGPAFLAPVMRAMPLTYLADAIRQATVQATAVNSLGLDALVLLGWLVVSFAASVRLFRWE